jgi:hypothetical protein
MAKKTILILIIILIAVAALYLWAKTVEIPKTAEPVDWNQFEPAERAVMDYLLTQGRFSWKTRENSQNFCAVENLDSEKELFPLYFWAYCGEFAVENGKLKTLSGSSGPVKIDYPNELSFYDPARFSYEALGDGSRYAEDIKRIFPEAVQNKIFNFDRKNIIEKTEALALNSMTAWESIKRAIGECEVKKVFQAHNRTVKAEFKNGEKLTAIEPEIDDIMDLAVSAEPKCGKIILSTE